MDIHSEKIANDVEFQRIINDLVSEDIVKRMKEFRQHGDTSCFEHCYMAAYYCYVICKRLKWDYVSATRAAMLHDLFLYDWRVKQPGTKGLHAFTHGKIAYENASRVFVLNDREKDIILKHMWPTVIVPPKYKEGFVLTVVDKYCAVNETIGVLIFDILKFYWKIKYIIYFCVPCCRHYKWLQSRSVLPRLVAARHLKRYIIYLFFRNNIEKSKLK